MQAVMEYGTKPYKPRLSERVNLRMLTIIAVFSLLVGVPVYKFVKAEITHGVEKSGDGYFVDLKSLGNFPFDEFNSTVDNIPADYRKLDGQKVTLEGFIYAGNSAGDKVSDFQFVYNIQKCCFGGPPKVQERVFASVPRKGGVEYLPDMVRMTGTLHVKVQKDETTGKTASVYTMDVNDVEPS